MKQLTVLFLLCVFVAGLMAGCSGVADDSATRWRRYKQIWDNDSRQFVDDWDTLWLMDRNVRLSEYHSRIGK